VELYLYSPTTSSWPARGDFIFTSFLLPIFLYSPRVSFPPASADGLQTFSVPPTPTFRSQHRALSSDISCSKCRLYFVLSEAESISFLRQVTTDMCRLTTGICSEKCVVRRFRRPANVIECTYTNLDSTV